MNNGYLFALATLFSWTISTFVLARLSRLEGPSVINKAVLFFSTFLLGTLVCVVDQIAPWQLFTLPTSSNWLWLGVSGIVGKSVGDYCSYSAIRILGARRRSLVTTSGPVFIWLFGWFILDETMNGIGVGAMLLTITSVLLLINSQAEKEEVIKEKYGLPVRGLLMGLASAASTGLAFILSKKTFIEAGSTISAFHATWIRIIVAFAALVVFDTVRNKHTAFITPFINRQKAGLLFITILFGAVLGLSFSLIAITRMNAAAAYTVFSLLPVSVMLVSVVVYKKKVTLKSWGYSLLAVAGTLLLIWRDEV